MLTLVPDWLQRKVTACRQCNKLLSAATSWDCVMDINVMRTTLRLLIHCTLVSRDNESQSQTDKQASGQSPQSNRCKCSDGSFHIKNDFRESREKWSHFRHQQKCFRNWRQKIKLEIVEWRLFQSEFGLAYEEKKRALISELMARKFNIYFNFH